MYSDHAALRRSAISAGPLVVLLAALVAALGGCGKHSPVPANTVHQLKPGELTPAERKYGIAPKPDASITYQPDVIIVGGGAESIREQSANGFIWTIDANAKHAGELVPGKVMFLTGRAVGRVLGLRREGDNLIVTLGPVELTDVVREADIEIKSIPLDFDQALSYSAPEWPGQAIPLADVYDGPPRAMPATLLRTGGGVQMPSPEPGWDVSKLVHFKMTPVVGQSGLGVEVKSTGGDLNVNASAFVAFRKPTLALVLRIRPTGVQEASLTIGGSAGLHWEFGLGTEVGRSANVKGRISPPTEFGLPLGGSGLPLSVTVRNSFLIKTAFGARNSTLTAKGDYSFGGAFKAGYWGGRWQQMSGPTDVQVEDNLVHNSGGISMAPAGVDLAHMITVTVGIGALGFTVGPYISFTSAVGLFKGSDLGTVACKEATIVMSMYAGVGYTMPKIVARIINLFLSVVGIQREIEAQGSLAPSASFKIHEGTTTLRGCRAGSSSG